MNPEKEISRLREDLEEAMDLIKDLTQRVSSLEDAQEQLTSAIGFEVDDVEWDEDSLEY